MSTKVELTLLELSWLSLLQMYEVTGDSLTPRNFKTEELPSLVNPVRLEFNEDVIFRPGLFRYVAQKLNEQEHIFVVGAQGFQISTKGIEYIQSLKNDPNSALNRLLNKHRRAEASKGGIPASDRIVPLDHNSAPYKQTVENLDKAIDAVRSANDLGTATADERDAVVAEMSAVRRLLEATKVRAAQVLSLAAPAFQFIAKTFTQEGLKRLAAAAWDALKNLLG